MKTFAIQYMTLREALEFTSCDESEAYTPDEICAQCYEVVVGAELEDTPVFIVQGMSRKEIGEQILSRLERLGNEAITLHPRRTGMSQ